MADETMFDRTAVKAIRIMDKLTFHTAQMLFAFENGMAAKAYDMAMENVTEAEKLAVLYRQMPVRLGPPSAMCQVESATLQAVPIEIGFTEQGWFSLRLPRLPPKKAKGSSDYLRGILYPALTQYFHCHSISVIDPCVIIYRHVYDASIPERRYFDHDNIEVKFVTDAVALYVMKNDAPQNCCHIHCSAAGTEDRTEVYVVPASEFPQWWELRETIPEGGIPLAKEASFFPKKDGQNGP